MEYCENYQNVTWKQVRGKQMLLEKWRWWRLACCRVAKNLQFVKNAVSEKHRKQTAIKQAMPMYQINIAKLVDQKGKNKQMGSLQTNRKKWIKSGFPGGAVVENLPANAGDMGSSPGLGRSHMPWNN